MSETKPENSRKICVFDNEIDFMIPLTHSRSIRWESCLNIVWTKSGENVVVHRVSILGIHHTPLTIHFCYSQFISLSLHQIDLRGQLSPLLFSIIDEKWSLKTGLKNF